MSLHDFIHEFFNLNRGGSFGRPPENNESYSQEVPNTPPWDPHGRGSGARDLPPGFNFEVMMDPFKMQQMFEESFKELFKDFSHAEEFFNFGGPDLFQRPDFPAVEESPQNPRDFCLKPGLRSKPSPEDESGVDLFSKSKPFSWLDMLPTPDFKEHSGEPRVFSSFSSVTRKTVRLPDGSVKTEEIRRNADGTEERTKSHSLPSGNDSTNFNVQIMEIPDFQMPQLPDARKHMPRSQFLKPGFERMSPNEEKVDTDLDKQILESGLDGLPSFSKERGIVHPNPSVRPTYKTFTKKVITLPNGVVQAEEVVRNPDGTEQRTVKNTYPDHADTTTVENMLKGSQDGTRAPSSFAFRGIKDLLDSIFK